MTGIGNIAGFIGRHPLTRHRKLRAYGRVVSWQIASRLRREWVLPWVEGTCLAVRRGMAGATGNIYCGLHEFEDMAFLLHFLRRDDLFADVGANIGSYTVLASGVCRARSVAFEPDPDTFKALLRNVSLNGLGELVACRECALGSERGTAEFTVGLDTVNHVSQGSGSPTRRVILNTLDHSIRGKAPDLVKLDVEGFEGEVLRGAARILEDTQVKAIIIEDRAPHVLEVLQGAGFTERDYDPFARKLLREPSPHRHNALFVRDDCYVQERVSSAPQFRVMGSSL